MKKTMGFECKQCGGCFKNRRSFNTHRVMSKCKARKVYHENTDYVYREYRPAKVAKRKYVRKIPISKSVNQTVEIPCVLVLDMGTGTFDIQQR